MHTQGRELVVDGRGIHLKEPCLEDDGDLLHLQIMIIASSMNHKYACMAYEQAKTSTRRQRLLTRMSYLRELYFTARDKLAYTNPERLERIERELALQKQLVLSEGHLQ